MSKRCSKCEAVKPTAEFYTYKNRKGVRVPQAWCKECHKAHSRNNPVPPAEARRKNLKRLYNITPERFDELSVNGCEVCGTFEELCVDHDHSCCPGKRSCGECVRGVLCDRHNKAEGFLRGSLSETLALAEYIRRHAQ